MAEATQGDTVKVHYTGKLDSGMVFDSSVDRDPLEFTIGEGQIIPGFEDAVIGMGPGEATTTTIPPEQAYGPYREDMTMQVERSQLPKDLEPEIGQRLQGQQENGETVHFAITEVSEESVTLDGNHPLAGKELIFEIELVEIV
ncbi:MAG: peptidylprolyl isomerase [Gemmatimonadetes bacterium]|jgi:peptidylprolyl isomerase|nr:peptidylprolyl isomerase [Gemmatimonadota bacterium]